MTQQRKLAAVMFTDIVGYTALMSRDEKAALALLQKNRALQKALAEKHNGEFLKEMGDGTLLCFQSALDAVNCAMEIQESVKDDPDFNLRIGIHLGDIVFRDGDVFGDGVNVASRVERLAESGSICISEEVYRSVCNQPEIDAFFLDEKKLKNVDHPVRIYALSVEGFSTTQPRAPSPESTIGKEKSIIVLPFTNMSPDPDQEYFSDGLTEEIITDLSHIHDLLVISRSSAMTFKGTKKTLPEIARAVNVRYVLEGSVRKAGNNLRITAQLIDAEKDGHLWAEKYSGTLEDVFDIQEMVSQSIVEELKLKLKYEEKEKITEHPITDIRAYEYYFKARQEIYKCTVESLHNALRIIKNSMEIVGKNEILLASQGYAHWMFFNSGLDPDEKHLQRTEQCAEQIFELDPDSAFGYRLLGLAQCHRGKIKESLQNLYRVIQKEPNDADSLCWLCVLLSMTGHTKIALPLSEKLIKIDPQSRWNAMFAAVTLYYDRQYLQAVNLMKPAYEKEPENSGFLLFYFLFLVAAKKYKEAFSLTGEPAKNIPDEFSTRLPHFLKYALKNDKGKALEMATDKLKESAKNDLQYSVFLAEGFSLLNERVEAVKWLENAVNRGFINYPFLNEYDPLLDNIRGEESFKKLMKRVKKEWENFEI